MQICKTFAFGALLFALVASKPLAADEVLADTDSACSTDCDNCEHKCCLLNGCKFLDELFEGGVCSDDSCPPCPDECDNCDRKCCCCKCLAKFLSEDNYCDAACCDPPCGDNCDLCGHKCCWFPNCNLLGGESCLGLYESDHCFDSFISPLSNPFYFEDPRSLTEVRGIYINNKVPDDVGGGHVNVWAGQARARITENLSIIVPRMGRIDEDSNDPGAPDGWLSTPVGFKYNIVRDWRRKMLLSGGMTYFFPGQGSAYANFGDGDVHIFLSGGAEITKRSHWISGTGFRIPVDGNDGTEMWYWSNQVDYELPGHIYPLVGLNWFRFMNDSAVSGSQITGLDLLNIPVSGIDGDDIVTCALGGKWKPIGNVEVGSGYEFPLTNRKDALQDRVYVDLILRY